MNPTLPSDGNAPDFAMEDALQDHPAAPELVSAEPSKGKSGSKQLRKRKGRVSFRMQTCFQHFLGSNSRELGKADDGVSHRCSQERGNESWRQARAIFIFTHL